MTVQFDKDGFALNSGYVDVYVTDTNGIYTHKATEYVVVGTGLSLGAYIDAPPDNKDGFVIKRVNDKWQYIADHRGEKVYSIIDGAEIDIKEIGECLDNTTTQPRPTEAHIWNGKWILSDEKQEELIKSKREQLIDNIDNIAATLIAKWTRFESEYKEREKAALAFKENQYQGEPSIYIKGFADAANIDNKTATDIILKQAEQLRNTLAQMSVLRMRKYELKQDNLTLEQMQAIHDDVVSKMQALAETQK